MTQRDELARLLRNLRFPSGDCLDTGEPEFAADAILSAGWTKQSAWQDIETAPKDGTVIMVYDARPEYGVFSSSFESGIWQSRLWPSARPTHWMPLPDPPGTSSAPKQSADVARLVKVVRKLVVCARTSGGVAGRDKGLCLACEDVEEALAAFDKHGSDAAANTVPEYSGWTCGRCKGPVAGRFDTCKRCGYGPEAPPAKD